MYKGKAMTYRITEITRLMDYEYGLVEGDLSRVDERAIKSALPSAMKYDEFIHKVKQGHIVLLSDSPSIPLLTKEKDSFGVGGWVLNGKVSEQYDAAAQNALLARTRMSGGLSETTQSLSDTPLFDVDSYVPESAKSDPTKQRLLNYEYSFEVACSNKSGRHTVNCDFVLAETKKDMLYGRWTEHKTEQGVRYTVRVEENEPKRLVAQVASLPLGISPKQEVKVRAAGSHIADECFIPVSPAVQLNGRLGFPSEGFYYHFHDGQLIQEYKIIGDNNWGFYATCSMHHNLNAARGYNTDQTSILVFWKLDGKVVSNQYLVYLDKQITREELDNLNDEWLNQHGVKLDIPALLEVKYQPIIERQEDKKAQENTPPSEPLNHIVQTDPETGQRETWMKIAEQYGLAPLELLSLNPEYTDPMSLAVGHSLNVKKVEAKVIERPVVYEMPPVSPQVYNQPLNSIYKYTLSNLIGSSVKAINSANFVENDIAIVNLKDVSPHKVLAKSCEQPYGCINAGVEPEPMNNFGWWSLFFGQAHAAPIAPAIQTAQQVQMAQTAAVASGAGHPTIDKTQPPTTIGLNKYTGTFRDPILDRYLWEILGNASPVLFVLRPFMFKDDSQYNEQELRSIDEVQSRIRVIVSEADTTYPKIRAFHMDDTRIPVKYVGMDENKRYSVVLDEESGATIVWTPADHGVPSWQTTPDHDDGFKPENILVNPIPSNDGESNVLINPIPKEQDWRDCVLVFPESSGIAPIYIVYNKQDAGSHNVKPLEVGSYGYLAPRSKKDGMDIDHIPSQAALRRALESALGQTLTKEQERELINSAAAIAIPQEVHRKCSETYGGRNQADKQQVDAGDLESAVNSNFDAIKGCLKNEGYTEQELEHARAQLHEINIKNGWYK